MKKFLLSAFALIFALTVGATIETGDCSNSDPDFSTQLEEASTITFCQGSIVTWTGGSDQWKIGGSGTFTINGSSIDFNDGPSAETNPKNDSGSIGASTTSLPTEGAYYQFTVTESGYLYILGKFDPSKHFVAWEGENRIPYTFVAYDDAVSGSVITCDLSTLIASDNVDENGYLSTSYSILTLENYFDAAGYSGYSTSNHTGAYARIAVKKGETYTFCGTGTKVTLYGYVFASEEETITIGYSNTTLSSETVPVISSGDDEEDDGDDNNGDTVTSSDYECYFYADSEGNLALSNDFYTTTNGELKANHGTVTYNGQTYTDAYHFDTGAAISFDTSSLGEATLTLVIDDSETFKVTLDNEDWTPTSDGNGVVTTTLAAGSHTIAKASSSGTKSYIYFMDLTFTDDENGTGGDDTDDGIIKLDLENGTESSFESTTNVYYSVTIPDDAESGTLTICSSNDNIKECLYTNSDCTDGEVSGVYSYTSPNTYYKYTGLTAGTTYYGYIAAMFGSASGTISATYETTGGGTGSDITITLAETITSLSDGDAITVNTENMPENAGIKLDVYDGEGEWVFGNQWFTAGENGTYTYTWDAETAAYYMETGTYTIKVSVYSTSGSASSDLLKDEAVLIESCELEGAAAHGTATLEANPASGSTITSTGSDQTIELTFGSDVIITQDGTTGISLGHGSYDYNITIENGEGNTEQASTTWKLTITDTQLQSAISEREGNLSIIIYATDADGAAVYDEEDNTYFELDYTVEGGVIQPSWSDIEIETILTTDGRSLNELTTDDSEIVVTFTDGTNAADVTVIDDNSKDYYSYVTVGDNDYAVTATNNDDTEATSSSWTLKLSEEAVAAIAAAVEESEPCAITVVVVAQDDNEYYVQSSTQEGSFPTFDGAVYAPTSGTETPYTFETDPYSGETVESLSEITVTIDGEDEGAFIEIADDGDDLSVIKVYSTDDETNAVAYAVDYDPIYNDPDEEDYKVGVTFTLNTTITDNGTYKVVIPAGYFMCGSATNLSLEKDIIVIVQQSVDYSLTVTPANGDKVDSIASITIIEDNGQELTLQGYEEDIGVLDANGNVYVTGKVNGIYDNEEENVMTGADGVSEIGYVIPLDSTITVAGTYTIVIPEEFVMYGNYNATKGNAEIRITVEVTGGDTSGIKGVTLRATDDDRFYNLNGQRVTAPRNGVFILNGKKVLIK